VAEMIMPKVGDAMTEGKVIRWYKKAGDAVKKGEPVLEIETDKVNLDLEAENDGILEDIRAEEGKIVPVGERVAFIRGEGESAGPAPEKKSEATPEAKPETKPAKAAKKKSEAEPVEGKPEPEAPKAEPAPKESAPQSDGSEGGAGRRRSSPLARRMARELGVSIDALEGSGPRGRIVASDVKRGASAPKAQSAAPAAAPQLEKPQPKFVKAPPLEQKDLPLTAMRRTIAKRLAESTGPIPHFYLTVDLDVTLMQSLRQQFNEIEGVRVSLNDFIVRAAALALRHHPNVNASWSDDAIHLHGDVHVGIAVSTPEGLITPVVRSADTKSIPDIAEEIRTLAGKAKNRKLKPEEYQGSTFTISNLGAWGIDEFTAIINPPNVAILAIGSASPQPVVQNGQVVIRDRMRVTMSCDHRVIDGVAGAEYLKTFRQYVEQPLRLLV
jgi:pyruvate dehydrogenase E2 component (dihydrolipoamide acetyltransferase)